MTHLRSLALAALLAGGAGACASDKQPSTEQAATPGGVDTAAALVPGSATAAGDVTAAGRGDTASGPTVPPPPGGRSAKPLDSSAPTGSPAVRALYVNRFAAQSSKRMRQLLEWADQTEINGLVIDLKDEFGLNYHSANPAFARNEGEMGKLRNVRALVDSLHAHKLMAIARIVVFKDSVTARVNPQWTIRRTDNEIWRDHKGLAWVNPYHRELWDYNIGVAEEAVRLGFDEIQFDYIRFPEPYKSLPQQVFPDNRGQSKPEAIKEFLHTAKVRLNKLGVRTTADIFGLVTTVEGPLEVAQHWERVAPVTDVLLPMVYPSHYPPGSFNIPRPNAEPYKIISIAINRARQRDQKLGITAPEHVRPWLQAFSLGKPDYGPAQIEQQKQAVYDAGYDGWVLWHPGSRYEAFLPALEKGELVSRKKSH